MRTAIKALLFSCTGFLTTGCTIFQLDSLVPAAAISETQDPLYTITMCHPTSKLTPSALADRHMAKIRSIHNRADTIQASLPPQLASDPVFNSMVANIKYISTTSLVKARQKLSGTNEITPEDASYLAKAPKPPPISHTDIPSFLHNISSLALRNTANPASAGDSYNQQLFWSKADQYYKAYFAGNFVTYFMQQLPKPTLSATITDAEIDNAALVFIEFVFDEILQPTFWYGKDGKYYPAGVALKIPPTYLTVNNILPGSLEVIGQGPTGCGMNYVKANTLNYLAQQFATAATAETSLTVKSAGGLEVGLGILGKLSLGDNSTLTSLLNMVVTDVVKRLTVEVGAPVLEAIDIEQVQQPAAPAAPVAMVSLVAMRKPAPKAELIRAYSAPFISATR